MTLRQIHPPAIAAAILLVLIPIIAVGGFYVRSVVISSLTAEQQTWTARAALDAALTVQLDEETGVRGFLASHNRVFLEPYVAARHEFSSTIAQLQSSFREVGVADNNGDIEKLSAINRTWITTIIEPLLAKPSTLNGALALRGKSLVDRYRAQMGVLDQLLAQRREILDKQTVTAVDRVTQLVVGVTVIILLIALGAGFRQREIQRESDEARRAVARAQSAYETEKRISDTLQEAFSLKPMPDVPRVRLSGIYVPATEETRVGGDWYDAVEVSDGRVLFAIGDVAGHGLAAAVAMNQTRQSMLTAALAAREPEKLLERVNDELLRTEGRMVTAVCGYADANAYTFTYATAGHPPPILFEPGRGSRLLEFGGVPMGVVAGAQYRSHTVQTVPGAMLVLYTDGAIEHSRDVFEGERALLQAVVESMSSNVEKPATYIRDAIFEGRSAADDVAIVTLTFAENAQRTGRISKTDEVELSASGPTASPGTIVSLGPRARLRLHSALPERIAS